MQGAQISRRAALGNPVLQDYKLGARMLLKYPGLTVAGGLALAIAIGVGAGYYDLSGKAMAPVDPPMTSCFSPGTSR